MNGENRLNAEYEKSPFANHNTMENAINDNGVIITHFRGLSMQPMLRQDKDLIVIEKLTRPLKKFDVPLYRYKSGKLVLHRIISIKNGKYIIRGDNLMNKEYSVTDDMVIGVLKGFYRNNKYVDCKTSKLYKVYIYMNLCSFPFRYFWRVFALPMLSKIKRTLFPKQRRS